LAAIPHNNCAQTNLSEWPKRLEIDPMKVVLPWLLVVALGAALVWQFTESQKQQRQLASARLAAEQLEALREEFEAKQAQYAGIAAELERNRKESKDLLRLRNEVVQLRNEKAQLTQQMQTAQTQVQSAQQQALAAQQQAETLRASGAQPALPTAPLEVQARFAQRYGLTLGPEQQQALCVNNLRQLEGAKQQWALENNQAQGAPVDAAALKPYLKEMPVCPAGGSYTIGAVGTPSSCSLPGHAPSAPTPDSPK
jgi:hypothetical protein